MWKYRNLSEIGVGCDFWIGSSEVGPKNKKGQKQKYCESNECFSTVPTFPCLCDKVSPREGQGERKHIQHRVAAKRATGSIVQGQCSVTDFWLQK